MMCSHKYPRGKNVLICTECGEKLDTKKLMMMNG